MDSDLSFKDIRFLRAVRDINANPEAYERTEKGDVPASTGAIIAASELSEGEVRYRMGGSQCRGFEEMGLTLVHEAEFDEETKMFGAKSVELTQDGIDVLTELEEENEVYDGSGENGDVPEVLKQLRGRVEKLEKRSVGGGSNDADFDREIKSLRNDIERLETKIDGVRDDSWGAIGDDALEHTKAAIDRANAVSYILQSVFGIDVERRVDEGAYPSEGAIEAERVEIADRLSSAEYPDERGPTSPSGEQAAQPSEEPSRTGAESAGGNTSASASGSSSVEGTDGSDGKQQPTPANTGDEYESEGTER